MTKSPIKKTKRAIKAAKFSSGKLVNRGSDFCAPIMARSLVSRLFHLFYQRFIGVGELSSVASCPDSFYHIRLELFLPQKAQISTDFM